MYFISQQNTEGTRDEYTKTTEQTEKNHIDKMTQKLKHLQYECPAL